MSILHAKMDIMIPRLLEPILRQSAKSILLLGPRQVGKSTLIQSLEPNLSINLNDEKTFLDFKSNPGELAERIEASHPITVFIDEIQQHPPLLNTIQTMIDRNRKMKFYITGSSARKLKRGQANLLPGRIFSYHLGPICAAEVGYKLNIGRALKYGCLPEPYLHRDDGLVEKLLTTYSGFYLKEEIQAESLTRNLDGFSRFINAAAEASGKILDFSKIAKQAKIERKICSRFYEILEDTLIATRIEAFDETSADIVRRPKYYFFDNGVLNGLLENFSISHDRVGLIFEHLVFNQIVSSAQSRDIRCKVSYFRTRGGYEVDFIVQAKDKTYAVEVKSGTVDPSDATKLEKIAEYHNGFDGYFIVTSKTAPRKIGKVFVCDLNEMLQRMGL